MQFRTLCGCFRSDRLLVGGDNNTSVININEDTKPNFGDYTNITGGQCIRE